MLVGIPTLMVGTEVMKWEKSSDFRSYNLDADLWPPSFKVVSSRTYGLENFNFGGVCDYFMYCNKLGCGLSKSYCLSDLDWFEIYIRNNKLVCSVKGF